MSDNNSIMSNTSFYNISSFSPPAKENNNNKPVESQIQEYGCHCIECKEYYKYAIKRKSFICKSCVSYTTM